MHLDREQLKSPDAAAARFARVKAQVLGCVRRNPGITGVEAVREIVGSKTTSERAAVHQLLADAEVVQRSGPRNGVRLYLKHAAPPDGEAKESP